MMMYSVTCAQCLDDIQPTAAAAAPAKGLDPEVVPVGNVGGACLCYCQDPSIVYCSPDCRSLHWFIHKHDCPNAVHSLGEAGAKILAVKEGDLKVPASSASSSLFAAKRLGSSHSGSGSPPPPPTASSLHLSVVPRRGKAQAPHYMQVASDLIAALQSNPREGTNIYAGLPSFVVRDGADSCARTQCATFISRLWKLAYGLTDRELKAWLQSDLVWGEDYYHHIEEENGFLKIHHIQDVSPGDLIAMKYERTAFNTGHVMLVESIVPAEGEAQGTPSGSPTTSSTAVIPKDVDADRGGAATTTASGGPTPPIIPDTVQWNVTLIDSTRVHHMIGDSRYKPALPGGIGRGSCRLYACKTTGQIVGYTWSNWHKTAYYGLGGLRQFAVGRATHFLEHVTTKEAQKNKKKTKLIDDPHAKGFGSTGSLDNFDFGSTGSEGSDDQSNSFGETSDNGDTHPLMSIKCGEATEAVGKELLACRDFKEAGIVWYSLGRSKRGGAELAYAMVVAAGCYNTIHKYEAALRAAEKVILEFDIASLTCVTPPGQVAIVTSGGSGGDNSFYNELKGTDPRVMCVLAYSQSAKANCGLSCLDSALQHYRTASFHICRWLEELGTEGEEEEPSTLSSTRLKGGHLAQWLSLQLSHFQDEIACILRSLHPAVVLYKDEGKDSRPTDGNGVGLGLKAAMDLEEGQLVLTEEPILVWADNDSTAQEASPFNLALFKAYLAAPLTVQRTVLSMHAAELGVADAAVMRGMLKQFLHSHKAELDSVVQQLVIVANAAAAAATASSQSAAATTGGISVSTVLRTSGSGTTATGGGGGIPPIARDPPSCAEWSLESLLPVELAMSLLVIARCNSHAVELVSDEEGAPGSHLAGRSSLLVGRTAASGHNTGEEATFTGIYSLMSKVQHSCSPNMSYDGKRRAYYALRCIKKGESLTFSYSGRSCLSLSTPQRRQQLHQGYLFHCQCHRCSGIDYSRGMKCGMKGCPGTRRHQGDNAVAKPAAAWICDVCAEYWSDAELQGVGVLRKERELSLRLEEIAPAIEAGELQKNQFEKIKQLIIATHSEYGLKHWLSLEAIKLMIRFYRIIGTQGATGRSVLTRNASAKLGAKWTDFLLRCASQQFLLDLAPVAVAEEILSFTKFWGRESSLAMAKLKVFRLVYPFFAASTYDGSVTVEIRETLSESKEGLMAEKQEEGEAGAWTKLPLDPKMKKRKKHHQGASGASTVVEPTTTWSLSDALGDGAAGMTITDLFEEWENYLSRRVGTSLNAHRDPKDLPPGLVQALRQGGGVVEEI